MNSMARFKNGLRWAAVLPASLMGCLLVRPTMLLLYGLISRLPFHPDYDSFVWKVSIECLGMFITGAAAVCIGGYIAPNNKRVTALVIAGLVLFASGALMFAAIIYRNLLGVFEIACLNSGSMLAAYDFFRRGEAAVTPQAPVPPQPSA
jgi:hypothetical protein